MTVAAANQAAGVSEADYDVARKPIRGSALLLLGRISSLGTNLIIQVLVVRYLSKRDYGAWAYAMSVVLFLQSVAAMGLDKAITRFLSIYHEQKEYDKLFGTALLMLGAILCLSALIIGVFLGWPSLVVRLINDKQQPLELLLITVFLVPVESVDTLFQGMFACFGRSGTIFVRRYVLGPILKLLAVLVLIWFHTGLNVLAYGYLVGSAVGMLINGLLAVQLFRSEGLFVHFRMARIRVPVREILSFTLPLLSTDLLAAFLQTFGVILLGYFHNLDAVGMFRVAVPLAAVNVAVMRSFALLYTPAAARLFAKKDYTGINDLYWRTAIWLAVLTFPVFAFTFSAAPALVEFLYGPAYKQAGLYLALLSLGQYVNAALGFNGLTLKVLNRVRYMVTINILAALTDVTSSLILIPLFGALGAAIGASGTMIVHNILKQAGLRLATGVSIFDSRYSATYACISVGSIGLLVMQILMPGQTQLLLALAFLVSVVVFLMCKKTLKLAETFPEVLRFRWMRALI
jgi:O-antigen/teichoic acid export membrane protein